MYVCVVGGGVVSLASAHCLADHQEKHEETRETLEGLDLEVESPRSG